MKERLTKDEVSRVTGVCLHYGNLGIARFISVILFLSTEVLSPQESEA